MSNLLLNPENLAGNAWSLSQSVVNVNDIAAPDGTATADQLIDNNAGGSGGPYALQTITGLTTSTSYTASIFARADQLSWCGIVLVGYASGTIEQYYDLTNGAIGTPIGSDYEGGSLESFPSGWYRCSLTFNTGADGAGQVRFYVAEGDGDRTVALDNTSSIHLWGAYLNIGSTAETYVSQAGITVTSSTPRLVRGVTRNITRDITKNLIDF